MKEFMDKVAVITGAASGIGRGLAERCAQEGMKVVLADIEQPVLTETANYLINQGADVLPVRTDVSNIGDIEALAQKTIDSYGAVHLLFNNAGVVAGSTVWETPLADWEWVLGVNLYGVIYGLRVFVPRMLEQDAECHIVNTASILGLISMTGTSVYQVAKHGIVTLSETLYSELAELESKIKVSVLCPGWVITNLLESERNRPAALQVDRGGEAVSQDADSGDQSGTQAMHEQGITPQELAEIVFKAIRKEQFYILTEPSFTPLIQQRMENILHERDPA